MTRHFLITQSELRLKLASNGDFNPASLCGNGNAHADRTRDLTQVTCPACWRVLAAKPHYLRKDAPNVA